MSSILNWDRYEIAIVVGLYLLAGVELTRGDEDGFTIYLGAGTATLIIMLSIKWWQSDK
jgi:hypothetical protein